jgi:signal transduction histidine kinase
VTRFRELFVYEDSDVAPVHRSRRDWVADSLLFGLAIGLGAVTLVSSHQHGLDGALLVVDAVGGALLCLALWWRKRWPIGLGIASLPILAVSSFAGPAGLIVLYTVAAYRRWQAAVLVALLQLALLPIGRELHPQGNSAAVDYVGGTLGTAVIVAWGMYRRSRRQAQRERARRAEAEEELRVEQIRHAERTRIAREMHDVLAHRISLLSLHAGALEFRPDAPPEEVARAAGVIRASAHRALEDLRTVIGLLRDGGAGEAVQPPQQTLAALPGLADVRVDLAAVPDAIGRNALRVVQEALTNARKHAPAAPVELRVDGSPGAGLTIEVRNPAPVLAAGTAEIPGAGTGLVGLAERAALSGGRLEHGLDGGDYRLRAWLPWPP